MPTLFIRLQSPVYRDEDGTDLSCDWLILENDGEVRASGVTDYRGLSELIDPSADWLQNPNNLVIVVPAEHVLALSAEVPGRSVGQIRRALPCVVEEFVAADIEGMHLAHGPIRRGSPVRVNLIDRTYLSDWVACFEELALRPGYMVSDAELLPVSRGAATVLLESDTALVRTESQAASVDLENLGLALGSLDVGVIEVVNGALDGMTSGQLDAGVEVIPGDETDPPLVYLARRWRTLPNVVNLLQGPYTPAKPPSENVYRWRAVATLAGIWLGIGLVGMVAQAVWAGLQADALQEQAENLYRDIFPGETRITNVRRQMRQKLGQSAADGGAGFVGYLGHLAQGIDRNVTVWSLTYSENRDELAADLQIANYDALEQLKQRLNRLGVNVEITSAEQQESGVRARIRLQGGGGADA
ncbi:MAG: type II secretion system protein GspL [Gammaproteobacteria bacterium]